MKKNNKHSSLSKGPCISVAMPVYNGEKYLCEAVDSVLNQSFDDFEFIIIDDGSTDKSLEILRRYEKLDSRIRLISRENKNVAATLNEIVSISRGEWIARMDQDDICLPDRFERQLEWLSHTHADICGTCIKRFGADSRIVEMRKTHQEIALEMLFCSPFVHPTVFINRRVFDYISYNENGWEAEDYDFWVKAIENKFIMTNIPEILLSYRVHPEQISTKNKLKQQKLGEEIRFRYWKYFFRAAKIDHKVIDGALKIFGENSDKLNRNLRYINSIFLSLFQSNDEAYWCVLKENFNKIYYRVAGESYLAFWEWLKFNSKFNCGSKFIALQIVMLSIFRIKYNGLVFSSLRKLHNLLRIK